MPFRSLGLDGNVFKAIQEAGYTEPTPIQAAAIPEIISGKDIIGIAQTGTGKTAAFTLPILAKLSEMVADQGTRRKIRALVIAPTRELVVQIEENVRAYAKYLPLRSLTIYGGVSERPQIQALRSGVDVVIATPGRLLDLMQQRHVDFSSLAFLVLDEADRMLDMGFLPDIRRILKTLPKQRQALLFSATLSREIEGLAQEFLHDPKLIQMGKRANPAETVTQLVYEINHHLKPSLLIHLLQDPSFNMVLVFSRTKHGADKIAVKLEKSGIPSDTLHANRSQAQRLRALQNFKAGHVRVLVATDIAARGIDVDGISHVINYDFPPQPEDYVHRIGRTGRAKAIGDAISFITREDYGSLKSLERFIGRGIVRKKADNFDYSAAAPPREEGVPRYQDPRAQQGGGRGRSQGRSQDRGPRDQQPRRFQDRAPREGGQSSQPNQGFRDRSSQPAGASSDAPKSGFFSRFKKHFNKGDGGADAKKPGNFPKRDAGGFKKKRSFGDQPAGNRPPRDPADASKGPSDSKQRGPLDWKPKKKFGGAGSGGGSSYGGPQKKRRY